MLNRTAISLWLHWSWRDLRARWLQVLAIAIIIALGTGVFAGLGGQKIWRIDSYDASYDYLNMYDLHVELASGSFVEGDELTRTLAGIDGVTTVETRLITPTLVDASTDDETIVVKGQLIGVDVTPDGPQDEAGPHVNRVTVDDGDGRALTAADAGQNVAVLEYKFARHYGIEPGTQLRISGDVPLEVVGNGYSPEYFLIIPDTGTFFAEANFAAVFAPLETVQAISDRGGLVNDALLLLDPAADFDAVQAEIEATLAAAFPGTGVNLLTRDDDPGYTTLYNDAEGDQIFWDAFAIVFLLGAAFGAFNLAGRMVEAQRREIGIGMALGVRKLRIALRPMLVGIQIALLGTLLGLIIGSILNQLFVAQVKEIMPLPEYDISFYLAGYVRATVIGITLPFFATLIPVWRAVRVSPIDAIKTGHLVAKGGGLAQASTRLPLPGKSFAHMPVSNLLRSPWRTLLTGLGIAIAIAILTVITGALDTYLATMDQADESFRHEGKDRVLVQLDTFYPVENGKVSGLAALTNGGNTPIAAQTEMALELGGTLIAGDTEIATALELHDMDDAIWTPALLEGRLTGSEPGIIISDKAAADLGVEVGDSVTLEHPLREGPLSFRLVQTDLPVLGIHDNPLRPLSYLPMDAAALMGLEGQTNLLVVDPVPDVDNTTLKLAYLAQPGVVSVEPISDFSEGVESLLELAVGILSIMVGVVMIMSFLIAFNSTSINVDERVREIATMFAFGLRIRTVTRMQMVENALTGLLGTLLGVILGWLILNAIFLMDNPQFEDMSFAITMSPLTFVAAALVGVLVVALTPLLSIRRMRRMDIPSTLRVME